MSRPDKLRIGYFPASPDFGAPSDRRRFVYYARQRGLKIEYADPGEKYDLVVLNQRSDLSTWVRYRPGESRIVYEANDSYISVPATELKQMFRGAFKFLSGQSRRLQLNYRRAVEEMCRRSDAVVVSTDEQQDLVKDLCRNVHQILDFQDDDVHMVKTRYTRGDTFNFVWEGLASSGIPMELLRELLEPISKECKVALHIITDLVYHRFSNIIGKTHTAERVKREFGGFARHVYVYQWNPLALSTVATAADMALIPIDLNNTFHRGKPENKLLLLWRMGVPTLTSATPGYIRAMSRAGLDMACADLDEWRERLRHYMQDESARERAARLGLQTATTAYSRAEMLRRWDGVMESLFGSRENWAPSTKHHDL
jgi:hypothetical protein